MMFNCGISIRDGDMSLPLLTLVAVIRVYVYVNAVLHSCKLSRLKFMLHLFYVINTSQEKPTFKPIFIFISMHVCMFAKVNLWRSESNIWELILNVLPF